MPSRIQDSTFTACASPALSGTAADDRSVQLVHPSMSSVPSSHRRPPHWARPCGSDGLPGTALPPFIWSWKAVAAVVSLVSVPSKRAEKVAVTGCATPVQPSSGPPSAPRVRDRARARVRARVWVRVRARARVRARVRVRVRVRVWVRVWVRARVRVTWCR